MSFYRCYFLNAHDRIAAAQNFDAGALSEAIDKALALLKEHPEHSGVELWKGAQRVYPLPPAPEPERRNR